MKLRPESLTILLMIAAILLAGCSVLGITTEKAANVSYIQSDFGPVSADSRVPFECPPYPDPSFESLIAQFKRDVAANIGHSHQLEEKRRVIANPTLLWTSFGPVYGSGMTYMHPEHWDTVVGDSYSCPHKNMVMFRKHNQKAVSLFDRYRGDYIYVDGVPISQFEGFLGKIFYTTKDQEHRLTHLLDSGIDTSSADYHRQKWAILAEGIEPLLIAKHWSTVKTSYEKMGDTRYREAYSIGLDFAEQVLRENPLSLEAMYYWAICLPEAQQMMGYQRILDKFPNAAFAHERIAHLFFEAGDLEAAQSHIQQAMQLDSRRAKNKALLAQCYAQRYEWEKAIAVYQSSEWLYLDQHLDLIHAQKQFLLSKENPHEPSN